MLDSNKNYALIISDTNERICLVKGKVTAALIVMKAILERIQEKIEATQPSDQFDLKGLERSKEMKVVVPVSANYLFVYGLHRIL